jgi:hypothetical protein
MASEKPSPPDAELRKPSLQECAELICHDQAFENTSTSVAASQMRNALTALADTCKDESQKEVSTASI